MLLPKEITYFPLRKIKKDSLRKMEVKINNHLGNMKTSEWNKAFMVYLVAQVLQRERKLTQTRKAVPGKSPWKLQEVFLSSSQTSASKRLCIAVSAALFDSSNLSSATRSSSSVILEPTKGPRQQKLLFICICNGKKFQGLYLKCKSITIFLPPPLHPKEKDTSSFMIIYCK